MTAHITPPVAVPADHLGLYLHIPFCVRKCRYCDFASQPLGTPSSLSDQYLDALAREATLRLREIDRPLHSIFIGGGTPTALTGAQLTRLWQEVIAPFSRQDDAEISLEANPGTLTDDVLAALAAMPLTRVSLGVQSLQVDELALLGRIHSPEDVADAVAALRGIGIPQLNLDLMYALPAQRADRWEDTLRRALALQPDHLSLYALMLEAGTPLAAQVAAGELPSPGEEEEEQMQRITATLLAHAGFTRYEVSNAARPGRACRHNLGYWLGREYLGLGPSAVSTMRGVRWRNTDDIADYVARLHADKSAVAYIERLSAVERLQERVMLGLRLQDGFVLADAEGDGPTLLALAGEAVAALQHAGWLAYDGRVLRLTAAGFPLANMVVARVMAACSESWAADGYTDKGTHHEPTISTAAGVVERTDEHGARPGCRGNL